MEQSGTVSAHLDGNVLSMLKKIAAEEDRSVSWLVGYAVKQLIAHRDSNAVKRDAAPDYAKLTGRQVDITEAIADAVKRGPVKNPSKHK